MLSRSAPLVRASRTLRQMATEAPSTVYAFKANDLDTNVSAAAARGARRGTARKKLWKVLLA